jgi:hypothetical protein
MSPFLRASYINMTHIHFYLFYIFQPIQFTLVMAHWRKFITICTKVEGIVVVVSVTIAIEKEGSLSFLLHDMFFS